MSHLVPPGTVGICPLHGEQVADEFGECSWTMGCGYFLEPRETHPPGTTWTVWWWDERDTDHMPVPMSRRFDTEPEAVKFAKGMTEQPPDWLGWIKVFRSDNEGYVAYRWSRPVVKIDADTAQAEEALLHIQSGFRPPPSRQLFFSLLIAGLVAAVALVVLLDLLLVYS